MSAKITIEPATLEHALYIGKNMRESDRQEVAASHGYGPVEAATAAVMESRFAYAGCADGIPFYLFGMREGTAIDTRGIIWGLGTDEMIRYRKSFWPASVNFVSFCRGHVDCLENHVDVRNLLSISWLKRLGFQFDAPKPYGVEGRLFMRFWMPGGFLNEGIFRPVQNEGRNESGAVIRAKETDLPPALQTPEGRKAFILELEQQIRNTGGSEDGDNPSCPLTHRFADRCYVREIFIPAGTLLTGKIHKHVHPNFLMEGSVSMITEEGGSVRMEAPQVLISPAGCKRSIFTHSDTRWVTVHVTNKTELSELEEDIIAPDFKSFERDQKANQLETAS